MLEKIIKSLTRQPFEGATAGPPLIIDGSMDTVLSFGRNNRCVKGGPGVRIAVTAPAAYDLWLERNIEHSTVLRVEGGALTKFRNEGLEVLAGLRPGLLTDLESLPVAGILDGQFTAVQQAMVPSGAIP